MSRLKCISVAVAVIAAMGSSPASAWGTLGSRVVAYIAYAHLSPTARAKANAILAADHDTLTPPDFVNRSMWADVYREEHRETAPWHYAKFELEAPDFTVPCPPSTSRERGGRVEEVGEKNACVVAKLSQFANELRESHLSAEKHAFALKMVIHLVGDIHEPLHIADHYDDNGSCVSVISPHDISGMTLQSYWDSVVVRRLVVNPDALPTPSAQVAEKRMTQSPHISRDLNAAIEPLAKKLDAEITSADVARWSTELDAWRVDTRVPWASKWAEDSFNVAKATAYDLPIRDNCQANGHPVTLSPTYELRAQSATREQLKKAGIRLAALLNAIWSPG